jgi:hypothetical protein
MKEFADVLGRWDNSIFSGVVVLIFIFAWRRYRVRGTLVAVVGTALPFGGVLAMPLFYSVVFEPSSSSISQMSQLSGALAFVSFVGSVLVIVGLRRLIASAADRASDLETDGDSV